MGAVSYKHVHLVTEMDQKVPTKDELFNFAVETMPPWIDVSKETLWQNYPIGFYTLEEAFEIAKHYQSLHWLNQGEGSFLLILESFENFAKKAWMASSGIHSSFHVLCCEFFK